MKQKTVILAQKLRYITQIYLNSSIVDENTHL